MAANMFAKLLTAGAAGALIGAAVVATAAPEFNTRGNRFKPLAYAELAPDQRTFADREIAAGRKPETGPTCGGRSTTIFASRRRSRANSRKSPSC